MNLYILYKNNNNKIILKGKKDYSIIIIKWKKTRFKKLALSEYFCSLWFTLKIIHNYDFILIMNKMNT